MRTERVAFRRFCEKWAFDRPKRALQLCREACERPPFGALRIDRSQEEHGQSASKQHSLVDKFNTLFPPTPAHEQNRNASPKAILPSSLFDIALIQIGFTLTN